MYFIGITGGVGSGKSSVLAYIKDHYDARIYLADQVAMDLQRKGTDVYDKLVKLLGTSILNDDGEIHRPSMANVIFGNPKLLEKVNAIVHPAVREFLLSEYKRAMEEGVALFFVEAALLIECGYKEIVDELWVIYASREVREKRLMENRGYSLEKIHSIMDSQLSEEAFLAAADFVIDNSNTLEEACESIRKKLEAMK